jgi:amino acid transporter
MNTKKEKHIEEVASVGSSSETLSKTGFYDPSKESIWTRLGLSLESFKRAPGTTGSVFLWAE